MAINRTQILIAIQAKLPNADVKDLQLTPEQKAAIRAHLRAVNARFSHMGGQTYRPQAIKRRRRLIGRDYRPRLDAMERKQLAARLIRRAVLAVVLVFAAENTLNHFFPIPPLQEVGIVQAH